MKKLIALLSACVICAGATGLTVSAEGALREPSGIYTQIAGGAETSGYCGAAGNEKNVTWNYDISTQTLDVSGKGAMASYDRDNNVYAPWSNFFRYIRQINIGDGITAVGKYGFAFCRSVTSVEVPSGVTNIGDGAFMDCTSLASATLPDGVKNIGKEAFSGCTSLPGIKIPGSVTSIGDNAFFGCSSLKSIVIPDSVKSLGIRTFINCTSLASVTIPNGLTEIGERTFSGCSALSSVKIPGSVKSIGTSAFYGCAGLADVVIPENVTEIGMLAFGECKNLSSLTVKNRDCVIYDSYDTIYNGMIEDTKELYFNGVIRGYDNSTASRYAVKYGRKFESISVYDFGDVDGDGVSDSIDASLILREYATVATGGGTTFSASQTGAADVNIDGTVDSSDASTILSYYAFVSTGGSGSLSDFLAR